MKDWSDKDWKDLIDSLRVMARGIARGNCDPEELVSGALEYLIKNKEKYLDHPNLKAFLYKKMKWIFIDEIRKSKRFTSMTDEEGKDLEVADEKQTDISEQISLSTECNKVLLKIKTMGEKCQEILMLASEGMSMQEMQEVTGVKSLGTVLSRLSNCRKELKGLLA